MEPNSREFYKQCSFQKYCNAVLHNEACDAHRELRTHKARTVGCCDESERDRLPVRQFIVLYFLHDKFTDLISLQSCLVHIY